MAPGIILSTFFSLDATKKYFNTIRRKKIHRQHGLDIDKHYYYKTKRYKSNLFVFDWLLSIRARFDTVICFVKVRHVSNYRTIGSQILYRQPSVKGTTAGIVCLSSE